MIDVMNPRRTRTARGVVVSTAHLIRRDFAGRLWETMVFTDEPFEDLECNRWATLEEAEAGHAAAVERWS